MTAQEIEMTATGTANAAPGVVDMEPKHGGEIVAGKGWLPPLLRTAPAAPLKAPESEATAGVGEQASPDPDDDYAFAAE